MLTYTNTTTPVGEILGALRREGDSLSTPELAEITRLPPVVVETVVSELFNDRRVSVTEEPKTGLKLIRLSDKRAPDR